MIRCVVIVLALCSADVLSAADASPQMATGIKIGEVTPHCAIIWTRLTRRPTPNPSDGPMVKVIYEGRLTDREAIEGRSKANGVGVEYPPGTTVADLRDAAPGMAGEVRVLYKPAGAAAWSETPWTAVDAASDFTRQFTLDGLKPATEYRLRIEARGGAAIEGGVHTAPLPEEAARVLFGVTTGQEFGHRDCPEGFKMYPALLTLRPDFFVHTGDIVYYDRLAKNIELARYHWQRTYGLPTNREFHRQVASYFEKDDHDTLMDDCYPTVKSRYMGEFTFAQGQAVFLEQVPMGKRTYRTFRWGKDLQIWLVEGRDFRSANPDPDGPGKTIWGAEQKAWFKKTFQESDATFRVLISPTPLVGPDRATKNDNHANAGFTHEGDELRAFIGGQTRAVVVCGDRHWQYHSVDPKSGTHEFSCGPASDRHAGGYSDKARQPQHRYLKVRGGFLTGEVARRDGKPSLTFRHYSPEGEVQYEYTFSASK
jgi:alkaline phosphatase D